MYLNALKVFQLFKLDIFRHHYLYSAPWMCILPVDKVWPKVLGKVKQEAKSGCICMCASVRVHGAFGFS